MQALKKIYLKKCFCETIKSNLTNLTHLTLVDCSNFLQSIRWETLENLIHLDIYLENYDDDTGLKISNLNKNIRYLRISGVVQMNTAGVSFDGGIGAIGFPELRILQFSGKSWDDSDQKAFRYCCANSPKLEEIYVFGDFETDAPYKSVAKSIGSLLNRPALRELELEIEDHREVGEEFVAPIANLFNFPDEKPSLEKLIIHPNCPLSTIYKFVHGNFNLKSLDLYGKIHPKETIEDIINVLNCDSGLETIRFGADYCGVIPDELSETWGRLFQRDEFPKLVEDLKKHL